MTVDIGEVFTRSWQIIWKHKVLWLFGFVMMLASFLILPLAFVPMIAPEKMMNDPIFILTIFAGLFLFIVALFPINTLLNSALTLGALHGERSEEKLSFMDLIRESYPFFWRVLGTMLLFMGGMLLVIFAFSVLMILISIVTFGLGMLCMMPLFFLLYPVILVSYVWVEQSMAAVLVDNMSVMDAVKHAWQLFRNNILLFVLFGLVIYFGSSMVSGFLYTPLMLPFFFIPFGVESPEFSRIVLMISGAFMVIFIPILSIIQGGVIALMKSGWVLTYLRLTRSSDAPQPVLQEAAA